MRIARRQRTLWRTVVIAVLDVFLLVTVVYFLPGAGASAPSSQAKFMLQAETVSEDSGLTIVVGIDADGTVYIDGVPVDSSEMKDSFAEALEINQGAHIALEPEPKVAVSVIDTIISAAAAAGATSIGLVARNPSVEP